MWNRSLGHVSSWANLIGLGFGIEPDDQPGAKEFDQVEHDSDAKALRLGGPEHFVASAICHVELRLDEGVAEAQLRFP
jgi:hypothetical protein